MKIYGADGTVRQSIPAKEARGRGITPKDVTGDICRRAKGEKPLGEVQELLPGGGARTHTIYPYKEKLSYMEKVAGYIAYGENGEETGYVRIVKRSLPRILAPLLLILAIIGGLLAWYLIRVNGPDLDRAAVAYQMPDGMVNTNPEELMLPYFSEVTVTADDRAGHAVLSNPEGNQSYFRYVLTLSDTGEEIYRSGLIEPGMAVAEWEVTRDLEPGDYEASLAIDTFSLADHEQSTNGGNMEITLHVE